MGREKRGGKRTFKKLQDGGLRNNHQMRMTNTTCYMHIVMFTYFGQQKQYTFLIIPYVRPHVTVLLHFTILMEFFLNTW